MSRITQDTAKQIAIDLTKALKAKVDQQHKQLKAIMFDIMDKRTPSVIKQAQKDHPSYFDTISTVYIQGKGFTRQNISTGEKFISCSGNYSTTIEITDQEHKVLWPAYIKYEALDKQYSDLKHTISNTLYQLRTHAAITKNFPEAVEFLPSPTSTSLTVPINDIRKQLKTVQ